ncbi:MAG TPA: hypothetical protein VGM90_37235 [Kofleriaceae bacterium]|jgi:hypothetical protein
MTIKLIALVPETPSSGVDFSEVERLVAELREQGTSAEIRPDIASSDDAEAFLVVFAHEPTQWMQELDLLHKQQTLERVVLFGCERAPLCLEVVERFTLAAAVDSVTERKWRHQSEKENGYGIAGRRDVVESIGGKMASGQFVTDRYCIYGSAAATKMVPALVEYLQAFRLLRRS